MNIASQPLNQPYQQPISSTPRMIKLQDISLQLGGKNILSQISFDLNTTGITSLIGPSGAGKSSLLRCINMLTPKWTGSIKIHDTNIRHWQGGEDSLRKYIGLIAQKPAVFPSSIAENVLFGLSRKQRKAETSELLEKCLHQAALWNEVKDRLEKPANILSIGQQQRLCLARALALQPSLLLLDEPTASLDPRSKQLIESSLQQLAQHMPVLCVTHDLEQAQRLQGNILFMCDGKLIEKADCNTFFNHPKKLETREFLRWSVCDC